MIQHNQNADPPSLPDLNRLTYKPNNQFTNNNTYENMLIDQQNRNGLNNHYNMHNPAYNNSNPLHYNYYDAFSNQFNQNQLNQNAINQNPINQNPINQNPINQNQINQNQINQN